MSAETAEHSNSNSHVFLIHFVQLSGRTTLLGADQVTWRFASPAVNIVAGGNGSGKSLLCSAIFAASYPHETVDLRRGLAEAGLERVTIVGQSGPARREWTLDVHSGAVTRQHAPGTEDQPHDTPLSSLLERKESDRLVLPHVIVNGLWPMPDAASFAWAGRMVRLPLERELRAWESRRELLSGAAPGPASLSSAQFDLQQHERVMAAVADARRKLEEHEMRARILGDELTEADLRTHVAQAEQQELSSKIELAERALRLESWANELRHSWRETEGARARFARTQERLEQLQAELRGVPEQAAEWAEEYVRLAAAREETTQRLAASERTRGELAEEVARLKNRLEDSSESGVVETEQELEAKRSEAAAIELDLKELSRRRIDLMRQREGLQRVRHEKYREMSQFSDAEWRALDQFLSGNGGEAKSRQERERLTNELEALDRRMTSEFSGLERLGANTPQTIEKLFSVRSLAASFESELAQLKADLANEDRRRLRTGMGFGLAAAGALGGGLPAGYLLGGDIGFFGAVVGGGVGYGIAQLLLPSRKHEHAEHVRQIERIQKAHHDAVKEREALEREISPLDHLLSPESALKLWTEFSDARERIGQLKTALHNQSNVESGATPLPGLLRKLEAEEIRRKVADYRELEAQLGHTDKLLQAFDGAEGEAVRMRSLEAALQHLQEELRETERRMTQLRGEGEARVVGMRLDLERAERAYAAVNVDDESATLAGITNRMRQLDEHAGGSFARLGAQTVLDMLSERDSLNAEARDSKQLLSQAHPLHELAARAELVETELAQATEQLQDIDPLYATLGSREDGLKKYKSQLEVLSADLAASSARAKEIEAELEQLTLDELRAQVADLPSQHDLESELLTHQVRVAEFERSVSAATKMCDALRAEIGEIAETAESRVMAQLKSTVFEAVGERIVSTDFNGKEWIVEFEDGQRRQLSALPRGLAELVMLCLNAGLLTCTVRAEDAPVVWDDVLSQLDDHHLSIARKVIDQLAHKRQVILLTRDARIRPWGQAADVLVGRHELDPHLN